MAKAKPVRAAARPRRKTSRKKQKERAMGVLFVLLILLLLAFAVDYILFHFEKPPIFALTKETEGGTEHIGLLYIVSDYTAAQPGRAMEWDWIWNKYRIERVD